MSSPSCSTFLSDIQRRIAGPSLAGIAPHQLLTGCRRYRSSIVDRDVSDMLRRGMNRWESEWQRIRSLITGKG